MKRILSLISAVLVILSLFSLFACGNNSVKNYKDGVYTGRSLDKTGEEDGVGFGYGEVVIEIKDNVIISCEFKMYELDGTLKDESYGEGLTRENRLKAQKAVQSAPKYAQSLVEAGSVDKINVITGATISYEEFTEAVKDALSKAEDK